MPSSGEGRALARGALPAAAAAVPLTHACRCSPSARAILAAVLLPPPDPPPPVPPLAPRPCHHCCSLGGGAASFRFLNQSSVYTLTDVDDAEEFRCVGGCVGGVPRACGVLCWAVQPGPPGRLTLPC